LRGRTSSPAWWAAGGAGRLALSSLAQAQRPGREDPPRAVGARLPGGGRRGSGPIGGRADLLRIRDDDGGAPVRRHRPQEEERRASPRGVGGGRRAPERADKPGVGLRLSPAAERPAGSDPRPSLEGRRHGRGGSLRRPFLLTSKEAGGRGAPCLQLRPRLL